MEATKSFFPNFFKQIKSEKINRLATWLLIASLIFFILWLLHYDLVVITTPGPVEYREGANILMTDYLLHGKNPFLLNNQPLMNNNYGIFYNLVALPIVALFGNTLAVNRIITLFFILLSCIAVCWVLIKSKISMPFAIAGGVLFLACMLFYVGPITRGDSLGTFLFLVAGFVPFIRKFNISSLILSGAVSILAFFTKPYFFISVGFVVFYLFLFVSKKKGVIFGITVLGALLAVCLLVRKFFPCYFLNTILDNISNNTGHPDWMIFQLESFAVIFAPLIMIFFLTNKIHPNKPFLQSSFDYRGFFLMGSVAAIFLLGQNRGNYLVYLFQLMTPALIVLAFKNLTSAYRLKILIVPLIILNLAILCFFVLYPNTPPPDTQWQEVNQLLASSKRILNSPILVPELVRLGIQPIDSGSSLYYYTIQPYLGNLFAPDYKAVKQRGEDYKQEVIDTIKNQEFDRILITKGDSPFANVDLISEYYDHVRDFKISMPQSNQEWVLEDWEPRKKPVI